MISRPKLLLADEPTGNVDDRMAMRLLHLFEELNKLGTTVIIATHNSHLVEKMGFPKMHLDEGWMEIVGAGDGRASVTPAPESGPGGGLLDDGDDDGTRPDLEKLF